MTFLSARLARGEQGSLAPSVAAIIIVLFLLGGLVIDGARALDARSRATAYAEEGARIAGQAVVFDAGELELDARAIAGNADAYCARISAYDDGVESCSVNPTADGDIVFRVRLTIDKGILGMVTSDPTMTFVGEGRAIAEIGITEAQGGVEDPPDISGSRVIGNGVDPNVEEASDRTCAALDVWPGPPEELEGFEYWEHKDYLARPIHCPVPPVCPNTDEGAEVMLPNEYKDDEITQSLLRSHGRGWDEVFNRCPVAHDLLYDFEQASKEYCGKHPGEGDCPTRDECLTTPADPLCPGVEDCLDDPDNQLCPTPVECRKGPGPEPPACPTPKQCKDEPGHPLCPELPPGGGGGEGEGAPAASSTAKVDDVAVLSAAGPRDRQPVSAWSWSAAASGGRA